jgi:TetR/AcrR family transcriptional repressor of nem operon
MRYDPDHKLKTRDKVLKAAAKAIRVRGPHRVGVAEVMGKAGLTHGGFYAHFASKDDLIAAAIERMFDDLFAIAMTQVRDKAPGEALNAFIDTYLSTKHRDAVAQGCPIPILAPELHRLPRAARTRFAAGVARIRELIADKLMQLGRQDAAEEAGSVLAELVGTLSLARAEPEAAQSDRMLKISRRRLKARLGLQEHA